MATRKPSRRGKARPPARRRYGRLLLLALVAVSLLGVGYVVFLQGQLFTPPAETAPPPAEEPLVSLPDASPAPAPPSSAPEALPAASQPQPAQDEALPTAPLPAPAATQAALPPQPAAPGKAAKKPLVAILIDDMGYQPAIGRKMIALSLPLSFSFLPAGPQTSQLLAEARGKKRDILLHLPLEATNLKPDTETLTVAMAEEEVAERFTAALARVPGAIGCNNHMGSRFTEQRPAMTALLRQIRQQKLFFLDSRTSAASVACEVARELALPCLPRQLFLDNDQEEGKIGRQIDLLVALAEKKGWAIGIGHPHPATLAALSARQEMLAERVEVVGIGTIFRAHGR